VFQLGYPVSDIVAVWVTFLGLGDGVEYSLGVSDSRAKREESERKKKGVPG
jgi:hypothetical protein